MANAAGQVNLRVRHVVRDAEVQTGPPPAPLLALDLGATTGALTLAPLFSRGAPVFPTGEAPTGVLVAQEMGSLEALRTALPTEDELAARARAPRPGLRVGHPG